ncbi:hypothetical protein ACFDTO_24290 [Microbacteriaceae bacterium 4G12]
MKRLGITMFCLLIGYAMFYDIKIGTLPLLHTYSKPVAAKQKESNSHAAPYEEIVVKSGDTVLSIVEAINKKKLPALDQVVDDFKKLNPNESPAKLRIGKSYKFPLYK